MSDLERQQNRKVRSDLLGELPPRKPARVMMHVVDAGYSGCDDDDGGIAVFQCRKCDHKTDWTKFRTVTEAKRGLPCPKCNGVSNERP